MRGAHVAVVVLIRFVSRIPPRSLEEIHSTRDVRPSVRGGSGGTARQVREGARKSGGGGCYNEPCNENGGGFGKRILECGDGEGNYIRGRCIIASSPPSPQRAPERCNPSGHSMNSQVRLHYNFLAGEGETERQDGGSHTGNRNEMRKK